MSLIEVRDLRKSFGTQKVLRGVDLTIEEGERIAIIGGSGCGKSVLLRCITLLERPDSGQILIDGNDITAKGADVDRIRRGMGMVFQKFHLFSEMDVMDNLCLAPVRLLHMSQTQAEEKAKGLLEQVGLASCAHRMPRGLSGGQQQRIAICRCLMMEPKALLMDEPTSALDPSMVGEVQAVIRMLAKRGMTMVIVTHEMGFAREVSTRVLYLADGGVYEQGTTEEVFDHPRRSKTKAFIRKIKYFTFEIDSPSFDLMHMLGGIQLFGEKYGLTTRRINRIQVCCEELAYDMLAHCFPTGEGVDMEIEVSYAEVDKTAVISLSSGGKTYDPFSENGDELGIVLVRNMSRQVEYERVGERNLVRVAL